ncbi:MAG TPA: peptidoglycan-binding domain-containing protein [Terriglobales bacterium]|nr:peptidoglycan-binding domain-containing protein [Terriglobales bacterium]
MTSRIRRWQEVVLGVALCLTLPALVIAKTDTPPPSPSNPGPASTGAAQKAKQPNSGHAAAKSSSAQHSVHGSSLGSTHASSHTSAQKGKTSHGKKVVGKRGQQAIDPSRAREIQSALIREHYLQGEPTGTWDSGSQAAMQKYQADHGWQSKTTPDARALIKLGLGPNQDHLLNPESAMTANNASVDKQSGSAHVTSPNPSRDPAPDPKTPAKPTPVDSTIPKQ